MISVTSVHDKILRIEMLKKYTHINVAIKRLGVNLYGIFETEKHDDEI